MDRLHVSGWRRLLVELVCEGSNIAVGIGMVALFFAIPAFEDTSGADWLKKQDLAVTFLDSYGAGGRPARHQA